MKNVSRYVACVAISLGLGMSGCTKKAQMAYQPVTPVVEQTTTQVEIPDNADNSQEAMAGVETFAEQTPEENNLTSHSTEIKSDEMQVKIKPVIAHKIAVKVEKTTSTPEKIQPKTEHLKKYLKTDKSGETQKTMLTTYVKIGLILLIIGLVLALAVNSVVGLILILAGLIFILLDIL
jgi:hypothetical protein